MLDHLIFISHYVDASNYELHDEVRVKTKILELSELIKACAAVTTAPPNLLEHIAREAHHLWRNLEEKVVF
ncbi:hypothetical protein [Psychrobacillus soli]|uniref:hypothetical protein n=1 Tax=Psychrobacillus soli TaxID=1543965 RepID=UPI001FE78EAD|nr:hypothetical protein [Psychrobacillus soli]